MRKELGKIRKIKLGMGGYQDAMFGLYIDIGGEGWGVGDFIGMWAVRSSGAKWTLEDRDKVFADLMNKVLKLLGEANKESLDKLVGVPVEVTFDDNRTMKSWRILKEVL